MLLEDEDVSKLLMSFNNTRKEAGFSEEEANLLINWAQEVVFNYTIYSLIIEGHVAVNIEDNEPVFSLTDTGMEEVETKILFPQSEMIQ